MPSYNSKAYIIKAIDSVRDQTYKNWELLITDDCSTDNSFEKIENYIKNEDRIKLFQLDENSGPAIARNNSIKHSCGRFIAFLDSDDVWNINKLEEQIYFMLDNNITFSHSSYSVIDENDKETGEVICKKLLTYSDMLKNCYIGCLTAIYDAEKIGKVYMPNIKKRQDWALWLQILKIVEFSVPYYGKLAKYRITPNSISRNKLSVIKYIWELYRNVEKLSLLSSSIHFVQYFYYYFVKKIK